jgi:LysM repeat protein
MSQSDVSSDFLSTTHPRALGVPVWVSGVVALAVWGVAHTVAAQPITPQQKAQAQATAAQLTQAASSSAPAGVSLADLAPDAPSRYTVKAGDTLWSLANLFLRTPWRWPELWGMNKNQIRNPHRIYPGQVLVLDTSDGKARLGYEGGIPTVKVSPRVRVEALSETAIPPIPLNIIRPFLIEALIVDEKSFARAPRIVAAQEGRVLLSKGDRAYARSLYGIRGGEDGLTMNEGDPLRFGVFRNATPLKDPKSGEVLGFDAQYVGRAVLVRPERLEPVAPPKRKYWWSKFWEPATGTDATEIFEIPNGEIADPRPVSGEEAVHANAKDVRAGDENLWLRDTPSSTERTYVQLHPATVDIVATKEEIRPGDRLVAEATEDLLTFVPHVPEKPQEGQIVRVYGNTVVYAGQNQVVIINRGEKDGLVPGHVLQVWTDGSLVQDKTDPKRPFVRLPKERNGLMMVFRTFERLSYALVLQITDGVKAGDHFTSP